MTKKIFELFAIDIPFNDNVLLMIDLFALLILIVFILYGVNRIKYWKCTKE